MQDDCRPVSIARPCEQYCGIVASISVMDTTRKKKIFALFGQFRLHTYVKCELSRIVVHATAIHEAFHMLDRVGVDDTFSRDWTYPSIG